MRVFRRPVVGGPLLHCWQDVFSRSLYLADLQSRASSPPLSPSASLQPLRHAGTSHAASL